VVVLSHGKPKQIADLLRAEIVGGRFAEGDLLGTEAELLDRFGVSRPSLREGLRILEAEGLVSVMRGVLGGVVVHRPDQRMTARTAALLLSSRNVTLLDVFEASAILEPAAARMVAVSRGRRSAAKRLRDVVVEEKLVVADAARFTRATQRFHEEIITSAGNQTLLMIKEMLDEVIARAMVDVTVRLAMENLVARRRFIRAHERLAVLVEAGDGDAAQAHWNAHMADVRRTLLGEKASRVVALDDHR
jgi:GntR family transcriptional regulator, transcriptional repressor for pyruvate dehydrogenase complex